MCKIYESFCLIYHYQSLSINFYWLFILFFCWTDMYQHYQRKQGKLIYKVLFLQVGLPHYTWLGRYKHLLCIYDFFFHQKYITLFWMFLQFNWHAICNWHQNVMSFSMLLIPIEPWTGSTSVYGMWFIVSRAL